MSLFFDILAEIWPLCQWGWADAVRVKGFGQVSSYLPETFPKFCHFCKLPWVILFYFSTCSPPCQKNFIRQRKRKYYRKTIFQTHRCTNTPIIVQEYIQIYHFLSQRWHWIHCGLLLRSKILTKNTNKYWPFIHKWCLHCRLTYTMFQ